MDLTEYGDAKASADCSANVSTGCFYFFHFKIDFICDAEIWAQDIH